MKNLKFKLTGIFLLGVLFALPVHSLAQWHLGISYQMRDGVPENGVGVHLQRDILGAIPVITLGIRAHFAYFSSDFLNDGKYASVTVAEGYTFYDYGINGILGVSLGFAEPYIGLGIGSRRINGESSSQSDFLWNGLVGLKLLIIPNINPFIEYKFQPTEDPGDAFNDAKLSTAARVLIGVSFEL